MRTDNIPTDPFGALITLMAQAFSTIPGGNSAPRHPLAYGERPNPPRRGLLERLENWFWRQRQRARDEYLAQSKDIFELEARMRDLERPYGARYY